MNLKRIIALTLSLALVLAMAACASDGGTPAPQSQGQTSGTPSAPAATDFSMPDTPINFAFSWWGNEARANAVQEAIDEFTARYPNVTIEPQVASGPFTETIELMVTRLAAGTEADINQVNYAWVHGFGQGNNVYRDLRPYSHIIDFSEFYDSDLELMTLADGQLAGVPHNMNGRMLLYNKPLLAQFGYDTFPTTLEDLIALGRSMSANNATVDVGNNTYPVVHFSRIELDSYMLMLLYSMTGKEHVVGGQLQYTVEEARRAYEWMVEMDAAGVQPSFANQDPIDNEQNAVWVSGRGGSTYSWISNPHVAAGSYMGGGHQDDIGMAVFPVPAGMTGYTMVRPGMGHSISRNTNHPEAVAYFLNYFYHDEVAVKAVGTMLGIPSAIGAFAILEGQGLIQGHAAMGLDLIISTPTAPMGAFWEDETLRQPRYAIQDALRSGNITVQQAAERFVNEQQAALDLIFR